MKYEDFAQNIRTRGVKKLMESSHFYINGV